MITRKDYLNDSKLFNDYYAQFVDEIIKQEVLDKIGIELLLNSKDEHLNDIPLRKWDALAGFVFRGSEMIRRPYSIRKELMDKLKEAGDGVSSAVMVCIYKNAARQIIKSYNAL